MERLKSMKELPESEKPYEKCLKYGSEYLSDAELIAVIIRTGSKKQQALELARNILAQAPGGILNLYHLSIEQLQSMYGIGKVKAVQLKCVAEISKRIAATSREKQIILRDAHSIAAYYMERLRHESKENLVLSMFDGKSNLIADEVISIGTCSASLVSGREIFLKALQKQAVYVILLHNHPSGQAKPSEEDYLVTNKIKECGKLLDIPLLDHIIIGDNQYFSFAEAGVL